MKNLIKSIAVVALVFASVSCSNDEAKDYGTTSLAKTIEETPEFSSFSEALEITGLKSTLEESGSSTVFVPTNDAFGAVLGGLSIEDFNTANPGVLSTVVKYHIVPNGVYTKDLTDGQTLTTSSGQTISVSVEDNPVFPEYDDTFGGYEETSYYLNGGASRIFARDGKCTNGTINVIDAVLAPAGS